MTIDSDFYKNLIVDQTATISNVTPLATIIIALGVATLICVTVVVAFAYK